MKAVFLTLVLLMVVSVFVNADDDKATEAEGPGRCAYCDEHTARIDERDIETNPSALALLHAAQSSAPAEEAPSEQPKASQGVK